MATNVTPGVQVSYSGGLIIFDATLREGHESANVVTEHAVELGSNVADHVRPELARFSCDVYVTNTPLTLNPTNTDGATGSFASNDITVKEKGGLPIGIPGVGAALAGSGVLDQDVTYSPVVLLFSAEFDRVSSVYRELEQLRASATIVTITTRFRQYDNMLIEHLSAPRNADDGEAVTFTIDAKQVLFAETQTVQVPASKTGQKNVPKGPQATTPSTKADEQSYLYGVLN